MHIIQQFVIDVGSACFLVFELLPSGMTHWSIHQHTCYLLASESLACLKEKMRNNFDFDRMSLRR